MKRTGRIQSVVATVVCFSEYRCFVSASAGVFQPSVFRGRAFNVAAIAARSSVVCLERSVPFGKYWRSRPFVFSLVPRCQGGCPEARRTLNGGSPALSAPLGRVRGANQVRADRRNPHEEGIRRRGRHGLGGAGESASTANPGGARRARRGGEGGTARAQRGGWARRRPRVDGTRGRRGRRPQEQAQP